MRWAALDGAVVWVNDTVKDRAHRLEFGGSWPYGLGYRLGKGYEEQTVAGDYFLGYRVKTAL